MMRTENLWGEMGHPTGRVGTWPNPPMLHCPNSPHIGHLHLNLDLSTHISYIEFLNTLEEEDC